MNGRLEEVLEEACGLARDSDDLVGGLPVELEVEFGLGPPVVPGSEVFEAGSGKRPERVRRSLGSEVHPRRLTSEPQLLSGMNFPGTEASPSKTFRWGDGKPLAF